MRRVVKLGGSLLTRPDLAPAMTEWLATNSAAETFIVVGGGDVVNAVRELDASHPLPAEQVHWICIDLLRVTFEFARRVFPQWQPLNSDEELAREIDPRSYQTERTFLVAVDAFYHRGDATSAARIPCDWRTTSDALAAQLAIEVRADEVVLLKSCQVPAATPSELAREGIVDEIFPTLIESLAHWRVEQLRPLRGG